MTKANILDKLIESLLEAPEDTEISFYIEDKEPIYKELYLAGVEVKTKEIRSIHSEDISLLQNQVRVYFREK